MNRKSNNKNRLLYDPNQRKERRLGAFSMEEEPEDNDIHEEELNKEEEPKENNPNLNTEEPQINYENKPQKKEESKTEKIAKTVGKKLLLFLLANPWLLFLFGVMFVFFIAILILTNDSNTSNEYLGLYGYEYIDVYNKCENVTVYESDYAGTYPLEEYIAGVVKAELGGFSDDKVLQIGSITARTYLLRLVGNSDNCKIKGNTSHQSFKPVSNEAETDQKYITAAINTRGLVMTKNGKLAVANYDAACYRNQDNDNYYIAYGNDSLGSEHLQAIPKVWAQSQSGLMYYINKNIELGTTCYLGHARGMSQWGAYYLSTQIGMPRDDIMKYYYGDDIKLMTIHKPKCLNKQYTNNVFIGDSRTVGIQYTGLINDNNSVAEEGKGYNWFVDTAINSIDNKLSSEGNNIIIWLGVNDLGNVEKYYQKYLELAQGKWQNNNIYIVKVGPVDDSKSTNVTNDRINAFNNKMVNLISSSGLSNLIYLDIDYNISSYDASGIHYSSNDYSNIYNAILEQLQYGVGCTSSCTIFKQGDSRWGSIHLGNASSTMKSSGCAVTSIAIGIACSNTEINIPDFDAGKFVEALNDNSCFTNGNIYWGCKGVQALAPNVKYVKKHSGLKRYTNEGKINLVTSYDPNTYFVLLHFQNSQHKRGHYVVYSNVLGDEFVVKDPAIGDMNTVKINEVDSIVVYSTN